MLRIGDLCLVTGGGELTGKQVTLLWPVAAKSSDFYDGIKIKNSTRVTVWIVKPITVSGRWTSLEPFLMPLRDDENPTTELSDVQRSDTVVA